MHIRNMGIRDPLKLTAMATIRSLELLVMVGNIDHLCGDVTA